MLHSVGGAWGFSEQKKSDILLDKSWTGPLLQHRPSQYYNIARYCVCGGKTERNICTYANIASSESMGNFLKGDYDILKRCCITLCFLLLYFVAKIKFLSVREHNSDVIERCYMRCKAHGLPIRSKHV